MVSLVRPNAVCVQYLVWLKFLVASRSTLLYMARNITIRDVSFVRKTHKEKGRRKFPGPVMPRRAMVVTCEW